MKFAGQVASYHSKLRRKSRFFSSLMLVSGISLAAAAPFLSYEVSKMECIEKGSVAAAPDCSSEVNTLKDDLAVKAQTISGLEKTVEDKNREIRDLSRNPDCDQIVRVITRERDELESRLTEVRTESLDKDESINQLRDQLADCELRDTQNGSTKPDCEKYIAQVADLKRDILAKDQIIAQLRATPPKTVECPSVMISGVFRYNEAFTFNGNRFEITSNSKDYKFLHGKNDVSSQIRTNLRKERIYDFEDRLNNRYQITFGQPVKTGIEFKLVSL